MNLAPSNMSSSANKTPAKSPTSQTEDPPDTDEKSLPDSAKTNRYSSPKDPLGVKKMIENAKREHELKNAEIA